MGKKVSALVEEQLQHCRALRQADIISATQVNAVNKTHELLAFLQGVYFFVCTTSTTVKIVESGTDGRFVD